MTWRRASALPFRKSGEERGTFLRKKQKIPENPLAAFRFPHYNRINAEATAAYFRYS